MELVPEGPHGPLEALIGTANATTAAVLVQGTARAIVAIGPHDGSFPPIHLQLALITSVSSTVVVRVLRGRLVTCIRGRG